MEMQASRTLAVTQQQAWEALNDPEVLKLCIPGCDKVEATGDQQYAIGMAVKIGPVAAKQLAEQGITTFAQLANLSDADIAKIDEHMPFSADQITDWKAQAKELAK